MKKILLPVLAILMATLACALPGRNGGNTNNGPRQLFSDDFSKKDNWQTGKLDSGSIQYSDGGLAFKIDTPNYFLWSIVGDEKYSGIHIEVTVKNNSTDEKAAFGVICNEGIPDTNKYYFAIRPDGGYAIALAAVAKDDVFLTNEDTWDTSEDIPVGASSYQIGVDCGEGVQTLYVNGKEIASVKDDTYTKGQVGLFAWTNEKESGVNVTFDDFVITELKTAEK